MRARCAPRACRADGNGPAPLCALLLCVAAVGCSSSAPDGLDDAGGDIVASGDGAPTYAPTFQAVYGEVMVPNCALAFCHGGSGDYLQLASPDIAYASLVRTPAAGPTCAPTGLERVDPGHPDRSLMFLKITDPPCGSRMPLMYGYSGMLTDPQINQIGQWITCGALPGSTPCSADASVFTWDGAVGSDGGDGGD
jgi:hypothetical protein